MVVLVVLLCLLWFDLFNVDYCGLFVVIAVRL